MVALHTPGALPFPIPTCMPALPVLHKVLMGDPLIVPRMSVPITLPVVPSPARVNIEIKARDFVIEPPTPVIIT